MKNNGKNGKRTEKRKRKLYDLSDDFLEKKFSDFPKISVFSVVILHSSFYFFTSSLTFSISSCSAPSV